MTKNNSLNIKLVTKAGGFGSSNHNRALRA